MCSSDLLQVEKWAHALVINAVAKPNKKVNKMPYKSEAQQKAMYAAAAGKSTLGIPKKVGKEFVKAGPAKANLPKRVPKKAAGRGR